MAGNLQVEPNLSTKPNKVAVKSTKVRARPVVSMSVAEAMKQKIIPEVFVYGYAYTVDWGENVSPRTHHVSKSRICDCQMGDKCQSVESVKNHLQTGGRRAPDYPDDLWAEIPNKCSICGEACEAYPPLDFKEHGVGWKCLKGGTLHYWQTRARSFQQIPKSPWLFRPVLRDRATIYPGVSLEDYYTSQDSHRWIYYAEGQADETEI